MKKQIFSIDPSSFVICLIGFIKKPWKAGLTPQSMLKNDECRFKTVYFSCDKLLRFPCFPIWKSLNGFKTSFKTRVSRMGFIGSFVNINIFKKTFFFSLFIFSIFFESLKSKSAQMLRPQKGNSRVSFSDALLNFGLRGLRWL